jgi:hypothetical protein
VKDGIVGVPIGCRFDPGTVQCRSTALGARKATSTPLSLVERWKERGVVPDQLIVAHYENGK